MGRAQCLTHVSVNRREAETDACTAYMRHGSDTMGAGGIHTASAHKMMPHHVIVRGQSRHAYHSSIRHSLLSTYSRTSLNRKGREGWEGPPLTLSLCQFSCNSLYTCRNSIMLLQCMLDLSLHVGLQQGAPQWQMSCTLYCVITLYNLNLPAHVRGRRQAI